MNSHLRKQALRLASQRPELRNRILGLIKKADLFDQLDTDQSGTLTPQELRNRDLFNILDVNQDGVVDRSEFSAALGDHVIALFNLLDTNSDGQIARSEWKGSITVFDALDLDDDGFISAHELALGLGLL